MNNKLSIYANVWLPYQANANHVVPLDFTLYECISFFPIISSFSTLLTKDIFIYVISMG